MAAATEGKKPAIWCYLNVHTQCRYFIKSKSMAFYPRSSLHYDFNKNSLSHKMFDTIIMFSFLSILICINNLFRGVVTWTLDDSKLTPPYNTFF